MTHTRRAALALFAATLALPSASAHFVMLPGAGNSLDKSIYLGEAPVDEHANMPPHQGARYYAISLRENQTIHIRLERAPGAFQNGAAPQLAIVGAGMTARTRLPPGVEIPRNTTAILLPGTFRDAITYEYPAEIATSALLQLDFTAPRTGTYTLIVLAPDASGAYGLHIDEPTRYGLYSLLGITDSASTLHAWEGQGLLDDWGPTVAAVLLTVLLAYAVRRLASRRRGVFGGIVIVGAMLLANTTLGHLYQAWWHHARGMGWSIVSPSLVGASEGAALLLATVGVYALTTERPAWYARLAMPMIALGALLTWNGGEYGIAILALTSVIPAETPKPDRETAMKDEGARQIVQTTSPEDRT